ncbi:dTDP-4-dehydrorhamnose reductase [Salisaeta longa]|uniref:dTDP-4-dehydrorhamnose reductase n=1 Tax=Salisaeta longa TaxID=503170 RepID=UPI0003B7530E|nr:dTDP-4-dehydrorhamnose reductase [Salisaeta longa]
MHSPITVLLTGAAGQLGRALEARVPEAVDLYSMDREALDITDREAVFEAVDEIQPTWLINAAAYTHVDRAETEAEQAFRVNADGAAYLAQAAASVGTRMVQVSTDFVFDGEKSSPYKTDDAPNPINVYGESKLAGEQRVQEVLGEKALIVRTAWLYGADGNNFVHTMLRLMHERDEVQVVDDQIGTPTGADSLAGGIWAAIERKPTGIHHWTDAGVASWYDFAVAIREEARSCGMLEHPAEVVPVPSSAYSTAAKRPSYSVLDKNLTWCALETTSCHWWTSLRKVMSLLRSSR